MGLGDEIMATGIAKRINKETNKKVAFGRNNRLVFTDWSRVVFRNNPKIIQENEKPEGAVWNSFCVGSREYIKSNGNGKMVWNESFRAEPGEFFFDDKDTLDVPYEDFIVVEPHTKQTVSSDNKQWPVAKMQEVINHLKKHYLILQFDYGKPILEGVVPFHTENIRQSAYVLSKSRLLITLEGGLHHAAAAVGCRAVVIYSGYISPKTTGYDFHTNLFKADSVCGNLGSCAHCKEALAKITPMEVIVEAEKILNE